MTRRFLISSLAVGLLALGGLNAQAGQITLPATLDNLATPPAPVGNYAVVGDLTFSNFTYTTATPPPTAADVTVLPFSLSGPPVETGISFSGGFFAAAGTTADYSITYQVSVNPGGAPITDAYLAVTGGTSSAQGSSMSARPLRPSPVPQSRPSTRLSRAASLTRRPSVHRPRL